MQTIKNKILPLLTLLFLLVFGGFTTEVWGADCNYTVNDWVGSKSTQKNGDQYRLWIVYHYVYYDYYDVPTFEFGNVTNNYGISHIKLNLQFSGVHLVSEKFNLQYKVDNGSWTTIKQVSFSNSYSINEDVSINGSANQKVYFRLERVEKAKFTDVQTLTLSGFEVRMAPTMSASDSSIDFGNVTYGSNKSETVTAYYTLKSSGNMSVSCTGDYSATVSSTDCGCSTSQQSKIVTVTFTPTQAGTRSGTLTITNPDGKTKVEVTLTGTGVHANPTLNMDNGSVNVTTNPASPVTLDMSTLKAAGTTSGIGAFDKFELQSADAATGAKAEGVTISGSTFSSTVGGNYTVRAFTKQNNQYNSTYKDFTVTVNRLTQTISWSTNETTFVEEDVISATSNGAVTLAKSGTGAEYISIEDNMATVLEVGAASTVTLTATAAQTDVYDEATDSKTITLTSLLKQHITFNQVLNKFKTTDATKKVELTATSDSGRDSYIYYTCDTNDKGVSVSQEGGKWYLNYTATAAKGIMVTAHLDGVAGISVDASPVSQMVKVTDPTAVCDINETLSSAYGLKNASKTYNLTIPKKLVLKVKCSEKSYTLVNGYTVQFYKGDSPYGEPYSFGGWDTDQYNTTEVKTRTFNNLDKDITKVVVTSNASKGYDITEASYERWSYANPSPGELNYEAYALSTVADQSFTLNYANYQVELSIEGSSNFVLKTGDSFGDCETYGSETVTVGYNVPATACEETAYLRIRDNAGNLLKTVTLHANVLGGLTQNITSTNIKSSYLTTDSVHLNAITDRGLMNFSYDGEPKDVVDIEGSLMTFKKSGVISVTVTEAGNATFNEATTTVSNITINKVTPTIATDPTVATIHYLDNLANSQLSEGLATVTLRGVVNTPVAGTFEWTNNGAQVTNNGGEYSITFKPTDTGMYANKVFNKTITIERADAFINMNNGSVRVSVDGIDAGKADSYLNLNTLIDSQTTDAIDANRAGAVTYEVISDNKANATIDGSTFSATVCGTYTIRATKVLTDYYNQATDDFTVTVKQRKNTLTPHANCSTKVEENIAYAATKINSNATIQQESSAPDIAHYDAGSNSIVVDNSGKVSFNDTLVTITIWQEENAQFLESGAQTIDVLVQKHDNPFNCSWKAWTKTINFDEVVPVEFTTVNTDYEHFPIEISQTSGSKVATLVRNDATHNTITASYNVDDATWHLSQAESYKYKAAEKDVTVKVRTTASPDCEITLYENLTASVASVTSTGDMGGEGVKLYFEMKNTDAGINAKLYTSADGNNWTEQPSVTYNAFDLNEDGYDEKEVSLPAHTRYIKFAKGGLIGTDDPVIRNIRVTADKWFNLENNAGEEISSITMPTNTLGGYHTTETFVVNYSTCADTIKVVSNHPHITVSADDAKFFSNGHGKKTITITYASNNTETIDAVITVYTPHENKTLAVHAETEKKDQVITWNEGFTESTLTLPVGLSTNNAASATLYPVKYRTNNKDVIRIYNDSTGFEIIGTTAVPVTLTAYQKGDDEYKYVEDTKYVLASDKKIQVISWTQDFTRLTTESPVQDLDAKVMLMNVATGELTYSAERTAALSYSLKHAGVVALDGKTLTILSEGTDTIVATIAGNEEYEAARVELAVKVKIPSAGCEDQPLTWSYEGGDTYIKEDEIQLFLLSLTKPELAKIISINPATGVPGTLTFQEKGTEYAKAFFKGEIEVRESATGTDWNTQPVIWHGTPQVGSYTSHTVNLQAGTRYIRFSRPAGGEGYHHIANIVINPAQFIEADDVNFGEMEVGDIVTRNVIVNFSNVKGDINMSSSSPQVAVASTITADCGSFDARPLAITCSPMEKGDFSADVTLSEPISGLSQTIHVTAHVNTGSQSITWEPQEMSFMVSEENDLNAALPKKTNKGQDVSYASSNESVIRIDGTRAVIVNPGETTITVSQPGDGVNFSAATPLLINVTIIQETLTLTAPTADGIIYGQALSEATLHDGSAKDTKGNTVTGTFAWVNGSEVLPVGTHSRQVTFTPNEHVAWYIVGTANASVTVNKATPAVTPYAEPIALGQKVQESDLSTASGSVAGTWNWHDADKNLKLSQGDHLLYVDFTPSDAVNYNSLTNVQVTLNVYIPSQFIFSGDNDNWNNPDNWNTGILPDAEKDVIISSNVTISEEVEVNSITIEEGAKVDIAPVGGLTIGAGGITGATSEKLILKAGTEGATKGQTGYLRISPDYAGAMPLAKVELYSLGYRDMTGKTSFNSWQYVGVPVDVEDYAVTEVFPNYAVQSWSESQNKWVNNRSTLKLKPFDGYAIQQYSNPEGILIEFKGRLAANRGTREIPLTCGNKGWNLVANSFAAPIDITRLKTADFGGAEATIHIWDTKAQRYVSIPVESIDKLPDDAPHVISAMQAFFVQTKTNTTMTLDYDKLVWSNDAKKALNVNNEPLRAPKRESKETELTGSMRIRLVDTDGNDDLFMLESEEYSKSYENGYDAAKKNSSGRSTIYAIEEERDMAVDATNSIIGTRIGVRTGSETTYTIRFSDLLGEGYALYDAETGYTTDINDGTEYMFFAEPNAKITNRFMIVEHADSPSTPTGIDGAEYEIKVHKFIKDNQLFILKNGVLYTGTGARVE